MVAAVAVAIGRNGRFPRPCQNRDGLFAAMLRMVRRLPLFCQTGAGAGAFPRRASLNRIAAIGVLD